MKRRVVNVIVSLVAAVAAVGFVATERARAAELDIAPVPVLYVVSDDMNAVLVPLIINKSLVIELPRDITDVLISAPTIVNAVIRTKRRVYIIALLQGQANVYFFDAEGRQIAALDINVTINTPAAPFIGKSEPRIMVTIYRGATGVERTLSCTPINCTVPSVGVAEATSAPPTEINNNNNITVNSSAK